MLPKKSPSAFPPFEGDEELARLTQRCSEIRVRRGDVHETIITVEKSSPAAQFDVNADITAQAEAMLKGAQFVASRERPPLSQLAALYAERSALDRALKIGESRIYILAIARAERTWAGYFSEIAEIEKRRVMFVFELQRTNRARESIARRSQNPAARDFWRPMASSFWDLVMSTRKSNGPRTAW